MNVREHLRWVKRVCGHCCISPWRPFARGNKVCQTVVYSPTSHKMRRKELPLHEGMKAKKKRRHISSGIYFQRSKLMRSSANRLRSCSYKVFFPELHHRGTDVNFHKMLHLKIKTPTLTHLKFEYLIYYAKAKV